MPPFPDFLNHMRDSSGNPSENEKGGLGIRTGVVQQIEDRMQVLFNPQFAGGPGLTRNAFFEIFDLEPVFYIKGEQNRFFLCRYHGIRIRILPFLPGRIDSCRQR